MIKILRSFATSRRFNRPSTMAEGSFHFLLHCRVSLRADVISYVGSQRPSFDLPARQ